MTVAVIIAGQMRTFAKTWANQYWTVYRKLPRPYFFVSVQDDVDADSAELLYERFPKDHVFIEKVVQHPVPEPEKHLLHGAYIPSSPPQSILRQLWALNRGWEYFKSIEPVGVKFDQFMRIRPDLWFHYFDYSAACDDECITPWWSRWGGINDRLAILGPQAAQVYFTAYKQWPALQKAGCPLHPESIMEAALQTGEMRSRAELPAWFSALRKGGEMVRPDATINDLADLLAYQ